MGAWRAPAARSSWTPWSLASTRPGPSASSTSRIPGREASHLDSAHDVSLVTALEAGRALGALLPDDVAIVTIEAVRVGEFSEAMTPEVAAAVPVACARVLELLGAP
jgi:hydrogenase maturation protease